MTDADHTTVTATIARNYTAAGLSVVPIRVDGKKSPTREWRSLQKRIPSEDEIDAWFGSNGSVGVAIITGQVSGCAEVLDFDRVKSYPQFLTGFCEEIEAREPGLLAKLTQVKTPNGVHIYYRCRAVQGNAKLAYVLSADEEQLTVIETRGEGGYVLAPGCPLGCNKDGIYEHIAGPPLTAIATITPDQREMLLTVAKSLNEVVDDGENIEVATSSIRDGGGVSPGDDFCARATWNEILMPHSWVAVRTRGDVTYWRRPGKDGVGTSATTGLKSKAGRDLLCVFSSNAYPLTVPNGRTCGTYSKFAAYAVLNHGGDFRAAAQSLGEKGFGDQPRRAAETADGGEIDDERQKIVVSCGDLKVITPQARDAVSLANDPPILFSYGDTPGRLERSDNDTPIVRPLGEDRMRYHIARTSRCVKREEKRKGEWIERTVSPPRDLVRDVLATPGRWLPRLDRIVEAPVYASDGTLQTHEGYHRASHTYYAPAAGFAVPEVSEHPTPAEVATARRLVFEDLLSDFPFVGDAERAHAVALLLQQFARDLIGGPTPLHLIEKPSPGTGATLLVEIIAYPAIGRPIPAMTEGRDEDEWRKRLTAKLRSGLPYVFLDNLRRRLDSAALASAITSPTWEDRLLGASEMIRIPVRAGWIASGNNPTLSSEIARRAVRIRMDAGIDRPWLRTGFRHPDLRGWASSNRGQLVWAALTIIRAWLDAGRPDGGTILGMFESWSKVMGGILSVAEVPGFLGNLSDFYDATDSESAAWYEFLVEWFITHGQREVSVRNLYGLKAVEGMDLGDGLEQSRKIKLGRLLVEKRDRIYEIDVDVGEDMERTMKVAVQAGAKKKRAIRWRLKEEVPF